MLFYCYMFADVILCWMQTIVCFHFQFHAEVETNDTAESGLFVVCCCLLYIKKRRCVLGQKI